MLSVFLVKATLDLFSSLDVMVSCNSSNCNSSNSGCWEPSVPETACSDPAVLDLGCNSASLCDGIITAG